MNYQKIYENLIQKSKQKKRNKNNGIYYENHHIIPKCLNGSDDDCNLVLLTAREHFIAHKLLTLIHKGNRKIYHAFHFMTFMNKRKYGLTSRDYQNARELINLVGISEETRKKLKSINHTKEWNEKIAKTLQHHIVLDSTKKKISISQTGKKRSEEAKENYRKGNKHKNIGVKHSKESVENAAKKVRGIKRSDMFKKNVSIGAFNSRKECEYCHKHIPLNIYNRCHGKKCKNK